MRNEFIDPICGMTVDPATAAGSATRDGQTYYFCSKGCENKFVSQGVPAAVSTPVSITRAKDAHGHHGHHSSNGVHSHAAVIDPVCGMTVDPMTAAAEYEYNGTKYYFCAVRCKERFAADP